MYKREFICYRDSAEVNENKSPLSDLCFKKFRMS